MEIKDVGFISSTQVRALGGKRKRPLTMTDDE